MMKLIILASTITFDKKKHSNRDKFCFKYKHKDNQCKSSPIFMTKVMTAPLQIV